MAEAAEARTLVDAALQGLRERFVDREYGALFATLRAHYRDAARASVKRLAKQLERPLADAERDAVERWAEGLAKRLAHLPVVGLKGLLRDGPEGSLDAFLSGLDRDLAASLRSNGDA